ncbi:hypothetical protein ACFLIN_03815 [Corynebacterium kutscheri]|uniref:hypothetical protein n=1 Tax=Corynebacterium kutscheri TaxID=35755 RepID=UPI0037BE2750
MARAQKICAHPTCGSIATPGKGLCTIHAAQRDAYQRATTPTKRAHTYAEKMRRRAVVRAWRNVHGNYCPGYKRSPHEATDLTAEHVDPVADTGDASTVLTVLCRSCNSRHGAETSNKYQTFRN